MASKTKKNKLEHTDTITPKKHKKERDSSVTSISDQDIKTDITIAVTKEEPPLLRALKEFGPFTVHTSITDGYPQMVVADNDAQCESLLKVLIMSFLGVYTISSDRMDVVLGFDIEFVNKKPVTIQLATRDLAVVLHIAKFKGIAGTLKALLESGSCLKAGVGVPTDAMKLKEYYGIELAGILDVGIISSAVCGGYYKLEHLSQDLLGFSKGGSGKFGLSAPTKKLSNAQIEYAAVDAWLGAKLVHHLYTTMNVGDMSFYAWCKAQETGYTLPNSHAFESNQKKSKSVLILQKKRVAQAAHNITRSKFEGIKNINKAYVDSEQATTSLVESMRLHSKPNASTLSKQKATTKAPNQNEEEDLIMNFV